MDPQTTEHWWTAAGAFFAGLVGLRGVQVLRAKGSSDDVVEVLRSELSSLRRVVHEEQSETRKVLTAMRTDLAILLDREARGAR